MVSPLLLGRTPGQDFDPESVNLPGNITSPKPNSLFMTLKVMFETRNHTGSFIAGQQPVKEQVALCQPFGRWTGMSTAGPVLGDDVCLSTHCTLTHRRFGLEDMVETKWQGCPQSPNHIFRLNRRQPKGPGL